MTTFTVYQGEKNGKVVYIGTTIQEPSARFRWHKANGKPLVFKVVAQFDNPEEMLAEEFKLIQAIKPAMNKLTHRRQNLNAKLTPEALAARKGDAEWCQGCLKRRVRPGYDRCMWC